MFHINVLKFVWDVEKNQAPQSFNNFFQYAKTTHSHNTRFSQRNKFSKTRSYRTTKHGLQSFTNVATTAANKLKDFSWCNEVKTRQTLIKKLKEFLPRHIDVCKTSICFFSLF